MTKKPDSRILREVHEMAHDLYEIGVIDKRRMREFDVLCHTNVQAMSPTKIKTLRRRTRLSQAVFASVLNTSVSTVQKWESGDKKPSGPSLKLLNLVDRKGIDALL